MISLFIDTSTTNAIVALYKDISPIEIIKEEKRTICIKMLILR